MLFIPFRNSDIPNKKNAGDDIVEALLDPKVIDALGKALGKTISAMVEEGLKSAFDAFDELKAETRINQKAITGLQATVKKTK